MDAIIFFCQKVTGEFGYFFCRAAGDFKFQAGNLRSPAAILTLDAETYNMLKYGDKTN